jgi:hypothetical protein
MATTGRVRNLVAGKAVDFLEKCIAAVIFCVRLIAGIVTFLKKIPTRGFLPPAGTGEEKGEYDGLIEQRVTKQKQICYNPLWHRP